MHCSAAEAGALGRIAVEWIGWSTRTAQWSSGWSRRTAEQWSRCLEQAWSHKWAPESAALRGNSLLPTYDHGGHDDDDDVIGEDDGDGVDEGFACDCALHNVQ